MAGEALERHAARYRDVEEASVDRPGWRKADTMVGGGAVSARGRGRDASRVFRTCGSADPGRIFAGDLAHRAPEQRSCGAHAPDQSAHRPTLRAARPLA